jgi:hypothetical protein
MQIAKFYNTFGTNESRLVSTQMIVDREEAFDMASTWNRTESRQDMVVNFILIGTKLSVVGQ